MHFNLEDLLVCNISYIAILSFISGSHSSRCSFPPSWRGKWFHLGFPEPLRISEDAIAGKGRCVRQSGKNMFLLKGR